MQAIPTECPRCNSEQNFVPKLRETPYAWQEEYIACSTCRYVQVIRATTAEIETAGKMFRAWQVRSMHEQRQHGHASATTQHRMRMYGEQWRDLKAALEREVQGGPAPHTPTA